MDEMTAGEIEGIKKFRKLLREYDTILVGDVGLQEAYKVFLSGCNIRPPIGTKGQKQRWKILIEEEAQLAKSDVCPDKGKLRELKDGIRDVLEDFDQFSPCLHRALLKLYCPTCQGTGNSPDREKIREILHPYCSFHSKPICPIEGNQACIICEKMTNQILALIDKEARWWKAEGYILGVKDADAEGDKEAIEKAERERIIVWMDEPCPHTGRLEEEQMRKSDCPKCWQSLQGGG